MLNQKNITSFKLEATYPIKTVKNHHVKKYNIKCDFLTIKS